MPRTSKSSKNIHCEIIGRKNEKEILKQLLTSNKSEFLALYGRRRIGKTFLIKKFFSAEHCTFFHCTGIENGKIKDQLTQFANQIGTTFYDGASIVPRKTWLEAFEDLTKAMRKDSGNKRFVLFFDEFPWMATSRSGLLSALEYFWNRYWGLNSKIKIIVCGSSASWVIEHIIDNKKGLYNRVTRTMRLEPFTLSETNDFLLSNGIRLNQHQVLNIYMVLGGIPHYLAYMMKGKSVHQSIDMLIFQKGGALEGEFDRLFKSLFKESEVYVNLVKIIVKHPAGIGQSQLIKESKSSEGGRIVSRLKDLENCGFISSFLPHGHHEKGVYYKVIDEYTLFYFYWIRKNKDVSRHRNYGPEYWLSAVKTPSWNSWAGYTFEAICNKHILQIRKALNITPGAEAGSWRYIPKSGEKEDGAQIDLLFDRPDDAITICEIKYSDHPFTIEKDYIKKLMRKVEVYRKRTRTQKQIFLAMITSSGLKATIHSNEFISQEATLSDLFKPLLS